MTEPFVGDVRRADPASNRSVGKVGAPPPARGPGRLKVGNKPLSRVSPLCSMDRSTETDQRRVRTRPSRRSVLAGIGGLTGGGLVSAYFASREPANRYAVVQGDQRVRVTPFSGRESVVDLYGLRVPDRYASAHGGQPTDTGPFYESVGTRGLQRIDTTTTFLYDSPGGSASSSSTTTSTTPGPRALVGP